MSFTTFEEVIAYMDNNPLGRCVREKRLDRIKAIMDRLGNPQNCYKTIHIAGSKGKGSTASYIASGIHALGYKTGLYLSPHVSDYRERFTIDGKFAEDNDLVSVGNELYGRLQGLVFEEELGERTPTTFELYTAFAFLLFKHVGCEWAVIETGLGGRLDATNILMPQASVLTPIELEHTELLGDTIAQIAGEKSKIIKKNTPSFVSIQKSEAMEVFEKEAKIQNSELTRLKDVVEILKTNTSEGVQKTQIIFTDGFEIQLNLKMLGSVQAYNCALAICVLRNLKLYRKGITEKALENNILPGRMEKINWVRDLYIDGAHTENSIRSVVSSFKMLPDSDNSICIFGCLSGKNAEAMGKILLENFKTIVISKPGDYKKSNVQELYDLFNRMRFKNNTIVLFENTLDALHYTAENSKPNCPVLVCGSFYLAGEIKEALCH